MGFLLVYCKGPKVQVELDWVVEVLLTEQTNLI